MLLDTSGSLRACSALASAKGVIAELCYRAYGRRQALELIGFSGDSIVTAQAARKPPRDITPLLDRIGAGGGTPLRKALLHLAKRVRQLSRQRSGESRHAFIFTDARSLDVVHDIALDCAVSVIDTEQTAVRIGRAKSLARQLGGTYQHIGNLPLI